MTTESSLRPWLAERLLRWAVVYLLVGVCYGLYMASSHQYQYAPVHAHLNLLGWASLALIGLIYRAYPELTRGQLPILHYWLHLTALPVLMVALNYMLAGHPKAEPVVAVFAIITAVGLVCFIINAFMRLPKKG